MENEIAAHEYTQEEIDKTYASALDSVHLINALLTVPEITVEEASSLNANVEHLKIIVARDYWTTQDLTPFTEAIAKSGSTVPKIVRSLPKEVTMRQARLALLSVGILSEVNSAINSMPSPQKEEAQIEWEYSNSLLRTNPLVLALGPALGMSSDQLDQLFVLASTL